MTSAALTERVLREAGVALLPGSAFGCPPDQLTARLAYVDFDGSALIKMSPPSGVVDLSSISELNHLRSGIQALLNWLSAL